VPIAQGPEVLHGPLEGALAVRGGAPLGEAVVAKRALSPVATARGLVSAGELHPGDKVLTYNGEIDNFTLATSGSDYVNDAPSSIQEIYEAFLAGSRVKTASIGSVRNASVRIEVPGGKVDDFHGDGTSFDGSLDSFFG